MPPQIERGERLLLAATGAQAEVLQLLQRGDAQQRIAALEGVVEEGEGPVLLQRDEPERELGHLDGHGVDVHAVEAAVGHEAAGDGEALVGVVRA